RTWSGLSTTAAVGGRASRRFQTLSSAGGASASRTSVSPPDSTQVQATRGSQPCPAFQWGCSRRQIHRPGAMSRISTGDCGARAMLSFPSDDMIGCDGAEIQNGGDPECEGATIAQSLAFHAESPKVCNAFVRKDEVHQSHQPVIAFLFHSPVFQYYARRGGIVTSANDAPGRNQRPGCRASESEENTKAESVLLRKQGYAHGLQLLALGFFHIRESQIEAVES